MKKGSSLKWSKVLEDLTDGRSNQLDPVPMLEYFKPLHDWLLTQNLSINEWECDKYLDVKRNKVRAYDEVLFSSNHINLAAGMKSSFFLSKTCLFFLALFSHNLIKHFSFIL